MTRRLKEHLRWAIRLEPIVAEVAYMAFHEGCEYEALILQMHLKALIAYDLPASTKPSMFRPLCQISGQDVSNVGICGN